VRPTLKHVTFSSLRTCFVMFFKFGRSISINMYSKYI
jgi:hypothetical protein